MTESGDFSSVKQSLVVRTGFALAGVILATLVGIVSSALTTESVDGDAATINLAGSLRMQTYRITTALLSGDQRADRAPEAVREFTQRLDSPLLREILTRNTSPQAQQAYRLISTRWHQQLEPMLQTDPQQFIAEADGFVSDIDAMVKRLEQSSESKIKLLRVILFISMFFTILVVGITLYNLQVHVVNPLRNLVVCARRIRIGKFDYRANYRGDNELGLLSLSFNQMSDDLSRMYNELELRVAEKTEQLQRSNETLSLLYESSRKLSKEGDLEPVVADILAELKKSLDVEELALCLSTEGLEQMHCIYCSNADGIPSVCSPPDCHSAVAAIELHPCAKGFTKTYTIKKRQQHFGYLFIRRGQGRELSGRTHQLLIAVCDMLASAFSLQRQRDQSAHLMLVEERATIARELHDSLAQSLTYQKMQIARLSKAMQNGSDEPALAAIVDDIRDGLNAAYRQLRELLTTFRLKLDQPGLIPAVRATIQEFRELSEVEFDCQFELGSAAVQLNSHQEIHCLQIIREALSNIVRHAQATQAHIRVTRRDDGFLEICIDDNGRGLPASPERHNHHGLAIMRERSNSLNGEIEFSGNAQGGTRVCLRFPAGQTSPATQA